jgi:hypothetical protein
LIEELSSKHNVSKETAQIVTGLKSSTELRRYLNFLATGGFLSVDATGIHVAPALKEFWQAVSEGSGAGFLNHLRRIPSFEVLYRYVMFKRVTALEDPDLPVSQTARNAYINLGEAAMAWLAMPGVGLVATDRTCSAEAFVHVALEAYRSLTNEQDGEFVLTGKWLEEVARVAGMHPLVARTLLQEACARNIINLYLEGSTPDTRFEDHYMWVLLSVEGRPELRRVFLYHGDFLTPGTASVRMRLEGVHDAT